MKHKESKAIRELTPREVKIVAGGPGGSNQNGPAPTPPPSGN